MGSSTRDMLEIHKVPDFDERDKLRYEAELMGIYVSGHPLDRYCGIMEKLSSMTINEVHNVEGSDQREVKLAGLEVFILGKRVKECFQEVLIKYLRK